MKIYIALISFFLVSCSLLSKAVLMGFEAEINESIELEHEHELYIQAKREYELKKERQREQKIKLEKEAERLKKSII
ncbi:MAG: hypothetical protein HRU38_14885 [Saccharospirillaceae bacterium]|nr:hypothetical protein [Pseudomonadales bacterium]NRB79927.1 hypothetical protein [Saccharospirillaceae bacterium]